MKTVIALVSLCAFATAGTIPSFDNRIVGGVETTIEEHPYQISLRYAPKGHWCGGSILDEYTILTAAHCVNGRDYKLYSVRVGATVHDEGELFEIASINEHEQYGNGVPVNNDVCIIKLKEPLKFNSRVQPIQLQPADQEVTPGTIATVTGWGATYSGDPITPNKLRAVDVDLISLNACQNVYGSSVTSQMLCAYTSGKDSCQGDSGGPLVANGKLIGVVSWGAGCASRGYPGVYANVANLHQWIVKHV